MTSSGTRHYSRFIPGEEIAEAVQWQFGDVGSAEGPLKVIAPQVEVQEPRADVIELTPEQWQEERDQAHARGLAQGREQARQEGQQQLDDYIAGQGKEAASRLAGIAETFEESLAGLQQSMADELLQLATDIARQVVRQELQSRPRALLPVVREALATFVQESRPAVVRLHPDDWGALESALREAFGAARVQWLPDASVTAGGCRVECAGAVLDATLETRWQRAIAVLGLVSAWREMGDEH